MIELSMIRDIVAIIGVVVAFTYYMMTIWNQNKIRQIQLISQLSSYTSEEFQLKEEQLFHYEWTDIGDFEEKYGSEKHPEIFAQRFAIWSDYNKMGIILKKGLVDIDVLLGFLGGQLAPYWMWGKYGSMIVENRRLYDLPDLFAWWEYLADEIQRYYEMKGHKIKIPENYANYNPDKQNTNQ